MPMDSELFDQLVDSVKDMNAFREGDPGVTARTTTLTSPDVLAIRRNLKLTREEFASLLNVSLRTVQSWEQGTRNPSGAAQSLLVIASKHPEVVLQSLRQTSNITREEIVAAVRQSRERDVQV